MTAVVLAVAAVAWVSSWHAVAVIEKYGAEDTLSAHRVPATAGGVIYASPMVLLWCARYRLKVPPPARWALVLWIAATLAANILHGVERGPLAAAFAAWPAIALVISCELIMRVIHSGRELLDREGPLDREQAGEAGGDGEANRAPAAARREEGSGTGGPEERSGARPRADGDGPARNGQSEADRRALVAALLAEDPDMGGAALGRALGVHESTGRKYRREVVNGNGSRAGEVLNGLGPVKRAAGPDEVDSPSPETARALKQPGSLKRSGPVKRTPRPHPAPTGAVGTKTVH
ncbi:hypothetical protein [Planomonospora alba]